jgi:hypothetical protein
MKIQLAILMTAVLTIPVLAQETNEFKKQEEGRGAGKKSRDRMEHSEFNKRADRPERTEEQRKEHQERRYQFMDKSLTDIGVSDEDKIKIRQLQDQHREKIEANTTRTKVARKKLSDAQEAGADEAQIDAAIEEITQAQGVQLKILVRNRMEMEKILGKEKYARLMENARNQFRQHGQRGGSGMPARPGMPPRPKKDNGVTPPPGPTSPPERDAPSPTGK